jgi:hypothetical protein
MIASYASLLLFIQQEPLPFNYVGWFYITLFTTLTFSISLKYLRQFAKTIKLLCIKKQIQTEDSRWGVSVSQEMI